MERRRVVHEGFLRKSPPEHKIEKNYKWHKRFFRLWSDRTLEYYKEIEDLKPMKEPINLRRCENAVPDGDHYKKFGKKKWMWFFKLKTPERTYHFIAPNKPEMDFWIFQINNLCLNNDASDMVDAVVMINGTSPTDTPRSSSVSSRSAWSTTSSSSNRSSPGIRRISPVPPLQLPIQEPLLSRNRGMSNPPDYRIPRSPQRSSTVIADPRDLGYDVLVSSPRQLDSVYRVPPDPKPAIQPHSPLTSVKQLSTTSKEENPGYVHMTPDDYADPYLPMDRKPSFELKGPSSEKVFKPLPFITKSQTLPHRPAMHERVVLDEIPDLKDKKTMKDLKEEAPKVNRTNKPPPRVNRAKKPSTTLPPRLKLSSPITEHEPVFHITTDTEDGMSEVQRFSCDDPLNNYSTPRTDHYSNQPSPRDTNLYPNQPITRDCQGQKITVGHTVHINLHNMSTTSTSSLLDYSTEPLPPSPYENSSPRKTSTVSNASDVSYVNDDAFEDGLVHEGYENVHKTNKVLRYSDVEGDNWMQHDGAEAIVNAAAVSEEAGPTGTHYVLVDTAKSDAVKLTLQGRQESRKH